MKNSIFSAFLPVIFFSLSQTAVSANLNDVDRSPTRFMYYQLGSHLPTESGHRDYSSPREVVNSDITLPIQIDLNSGERMFCNSQVSGFKDNGNPGGKGNHIKNFQFPMTSTMCEERWKASQTTPLCGIDSKTGKGKISHQGIDCRPPKPVGGIYKVVAVEDGEVTKVVNKADGSVRLKGAKSNIIWNYRHVVPVVGKGKFRKGDVLATITDLKIGSDGIQGTPVHLHLECMVLGVHRDCFPSVLVAYKKTLGLPFKIDSGQLAFNDCFEIAAGARVPKKTELECNSYLADVSDGTTSSTEVSGSTCIPPNVVPIEQRFTKSEKSRNFLALTVYRDESSGKFSRIGEIEDFPGWFDDSAAITDKDGGWIYAFNSDESGVGVSYYWLMKRTRYVPDKLHPTFRQLAFSMAGVPSAACDSNLNTTPEALKIYGNVNTAEKWCGRVKQYRNGWLGADGKSGHAKFYFEPDVPNFDSGLDLQSTDVLWSVLRTMYRHESGRDMVLDRLTFDRGISLGKDYLKHGKVLPKPYGQYLFKCDGNTTEPISSIPMLGKQVTVSLTTNELNTTKEALSNYKVYLLTKLNETTNLIEKIGATK